MAVALVGVSIAVTKDHIKKQVREDRDYWLLLPGHSSSLEEVRKGTQKGKNLEAGADAEAMEGCCLLACFPWFACSACFPTEPGTSSPCMVPPLMVWVLPH